MFKIVLGVGAFALVFSFVWITAVANGFESLHKNSEAFRSFSNTLYCGGETFSIKYGSYLPNPNNPNKSGGRSFTAECTTATGERVNVTTIKAAFDIGIFILLMIGGLTVMGWGIKMWINIPLPASTSQENAQA